MPKNVDEDLIEATIRRVAEQKARLTSAADGVAELDDLASSSASATVPKADEDPIEATIRRVAEQKARQEAEARAADPAGDDSAEDAGDVSEDAAASAEDGSEVSDGDDVSDDREAAIEETIRRVAEQKARLAGAAAQIEPPLAAASDEDAIEATIRRVAEAKAKQERDASTPKPVAVDLTAIASTDDARDDEEPDDWSEAPAAATAAADAAPPATPVEEAWDEPAPIDVFKRPAAFHAVAPATGAPGDVQHTLDTLLDLVARLEVIVPALERLAAQPVAHRPTTVAPASAPQVQQIDDDWEERPLVANGGFGPPPRPTVLREAPAPPPRVARPPAPPPLPPEPEEEKPAKRGLELLPRNYRITVEDKRRSVDLVPLHRALLSMDGVKDMSLLSYNNGIAIVSVESVNEISPDGLRALVSKAMSRDARVESHNENTLVVKLGEE